MYDHSEYLYTEVAFEGAQLDRFESSQILYPYFLEVDRERRERCYREGVDEMLNSFRGYFEGCADCDQEDYNPWCTWEGASSSIYNWTPSSSSLDCSNYSDWDV